MATESTSGMLANAEMFGWIGSGQLEKALYQDVTRPIGYGLNKKIMDPALKMAQNRQMFGNQLWHHTGPRADILSRRMRYSSIRSSPDAFGDIVKGSKKYGSLSETKAASYFNRMTGSQFKFASSRASESIRRLAAKKIITSGGKSRAAGYLNRSIWKMTVGKPLARRALQKAAVGQLAKGAHKAFTFGWQAGLLYEIGSASVKMLRQQSRDARSMDWGKGFEMTQGMYTERQRAVQAITSSRMSTRSAIGGEAAMMHR
jgi:hypothetical protein